MIDRPPWWNSYNIFEILKSVCIPRFKNTHLDELERLIPYIKEIAQITNVKTINSSEVAGSQIIARLLKFKSNLNDEKENDN